MTSLSPLKFFLAVQPEETVFTATVSSTPDDPYVEVSYSSGVTGSFGTPIPGMTVFFETTTGGRERGALRLKNSPNAGSGTLEIAESDDVGPQIESGDKIRAINQFRLWPRYPRFIQNGEQVTILEDYDISFSNQTNQWRPKAVTPPPGFGWLEAGQAEIKFTSVDQKGNGTRAMAPGASISSYLWTARGSVEGTSTSQGTVASPVTFTWTSPGWYLISLQVEDSNGNTDIQYTYVLIDDPANPQYVFTEFDTTSDNFDFSQGGGECGFTVWNNGNVTNFPQEGLVMLIGDGSITTPTASWPYRTNILFSGWLLSNTIRQNPETGDVSFRAGNIHTIMRNLTMFPVSLTNKATPRNWTQAKSLTVDRAAYFLYKYRSTLALMTPIVFSGYTELIQRQDFGPTDLFSNIQNELMACIWGNVVSTHQGVLYHVIDYNVQLTAERATATTRKTIHKGVWVGDVGIEEKQDYSQPVNQVKMSGVHYPGGDVEDICPLFSEAPGDAPKVYGKEVNFDRLILASQSSLNVRCGLKLAQLTQRYGPYRAQFLNDGSFGIVPQDLFPAVIEATDNERGLSYTGNLIPRRISRTYDHAGGYFAVSVDFEPETTGPAGVTVDMPCGPPEQVLPPTLQPDPPAGLPGFTSLIAGTTGTSFYFEPGLNQPWQRRVSGLVDPDQLGFLDILPDPWSDFKQGYNPDSVIVWGSGRGFLARSTDSGQNWGDRSSFLEPAPNWPGESNNDLGSVDLTRLQGDIFREDRLFVLASWQYTGAHHGAVAKSDDGFDFTWHNITGTGQVRPLGMSLDRGNGNALFVTTWESDPTGTIYLRRYNTSDMSLAARYDLGRVSAQDVDANLYYATPFNRNGQACEVWLYGRMNQPQGFTGSVHVLKNTNCGATGSYSVIENTWGETLAGSFGADDDDYLYAVRTGQVSASTISVSLSPATIVAADNISYMKATAANNDIVAVTYDNNNSVDPVESNYILYNRSTDTAGTPAQLNDDNPTNPNMVSLVSEKIENNRILTFHNNDAFSGGYGRVVTNSGTTPSLQPDTRFRESNNTTTDPPRADDIVSAKHTTLATGVLAYRIGTSADFGFYQTWTVASGNVSFGTAVQMAVDNPAPFQLDLKHWTGNKYVNAAYTGGLGARILDTTTGINEGDLEEEGTFTNVSFVKMARIDDSRMLFFFFDDTGDDFHACVGTLFGSDQVIWGDLLSINANSPTGSKGTNILDRGDGVYTIGYPTSSTAWKFESLQVDGTTVTKMNDAGTVTLGAVDYVQIIGFDNDEGGIVCLDNTLEQVLYRPMTGLPETGNATFYHGLNSLTQKFTLPWPGAKPQAMTLDKSLGTVVMGSDSPSNEAIIYSAYPYTTGTSSSQGFPTGTSVKALKWI